MMAGMALVYDYSWARPTVEVLLGAGCTGVMRYAATGAANAGKVLSIPERNRLWAAGIPIGLVWETTAGRPKGGFGAGVVDAQQANAFADRLEWPADVPISYAVDFDPVGWLDEIRDYFRGVLSVPGRPVGDYGSRDVVDTLAELEHDGRRVVCHWQCAGWSGRATAEPLVRLDNGERRRRSLHSCMVQDIPETRLPGTDVNHVFGHVDFLYHPDQPRHGHEAPTAEPENDDMADTYLWVNRTDSTWIHEVAGGQPGGQGFFKALSTDQFVRAVSPDEVQGHQDLAAYVQALGQKSKLTISFDVPDWMFRDRTLLPRTWAADQPPVITLTGEQIDQIKAAVTAAWPADFLEKVKAAAAAGVDAELDAVKD
jgi:hypothetical protein